MDHTSGSRHTICITQDFTGNNTCGECYVSIRSYLDKSFPQLLWENVSGFLSVKTQ